MPNIRELVDGACVAGENFDEDDLYKFVVLDDEREVKLPDTGNDFSVGDRCYGVLKSYGDEGEPVAVQVSGISLVRLDASVSIDAGAALQVEDGGVCDDVSTGNVAMAIAREDGDDDEIISCLIITGGDEIND